VIIIIGLLLLSLSLPVSSQTAKAPDAKVGLKPDPSVKK